MLPVGGPIGEHCSFFVRKIQLAGALQRAVGCNADHVLNANGDQNDQCGDDKAVQHGLCAGTAERFEVRVQTDGRQGCDHQKLADGLQAGNQPGGQKALKMVLCSITERMTLRLRIFLWTKSITASQLL